MLPPSNNNQSITVLNTFQESPFDSIRLLDERGQEYWSARTMQSPLGYVRWESFEDAIDRAIHACRNVGLEPSEQIREVTNLLNRGKYATQEQKDYHMTRRGCYLTVMNGDPRKPEIALAQSYFCTKTEESEIAQKQTAQFPASINALFESFFKPAMTSQPLELLQIKDTVASLEEEVNSLKDSIEMLQGPIQVSHDPIEQAIYTTLAARGEPITASELKWRCPETRELTSKYITKVCKRMARAKIIKRLAPVGTQYVPRFFV